MIVKELDSISNTDPFAKAGRRAEEQMAHYLRRAFEHKSDIFVFNGMRLEKGDDAAQIDHLIIHRWGMVVVESKSVTSRVDINEREEWTRWWDGKPKGMASPVLQAERQAYFLRHYLEDNAEALLDKIFGLVQARFGNMPIDVLVAISDDGIIKQPKKNVQASVCKADQVPDRVNALIALHKKETSIFNVASSKGYDLSPQSMERISKMLLARHRPLRQGNTESLTTQSVTKAEVQPAVAVASEPRPIEMPSAPAVAEPMSTIKNVVTSGKVEETASTASAYTCRNCNGINLSIEYGRYGYYFKCADCDANTPTKAFCPVCKNKQRIRKSGLEFFADCGVCKRSDEFL